jgi:thioredoxin reductase
MQHPHPYDVIIIGGSYAGLSAAMTLGRSLRQVLIIDAGQPANRQTPHAHNLIMHDGEPPAQLVALAHQQVLAYPGVSWLTGKVIEAAQTDSGFAVGTDTGESFRAKKLLLATGVFDQMPPIEGFAACWGISVLHCPYCHGYEVTGQRIGLLANGDTGIELVKLIGHWSKNLMLLTNGPATFTTEQRAFIDKKGVPIIDSPVRRIEHQNGQIEQVVFQDGTRVAFDAIFSRVPFRQHTNLADQLGCDLWQTGPVTGLIKADEFGRTNRPGVFAAGDNNTLMRSVAIAIGSGNKTGASINREFIEGAE